MYRLKYYSLSKEEKDSLKKEYYEAKIGKETKERLIRVLIAGIILVIFGIYLLIEAKNIWNYFYAGVILVASLIFIIGFFKIRIKKINDYLVSKKNKK